MFYFNKKIGGAMNHFQSFKELSPCIFADLLARKNIMDIGIKPLWQIMPRIAGPAFPVRCSPGDNLMLHAAIYRAPAGSIIVVETGGDIDYAVAGGNVCKIAAKRGIVGFIVDGVIRDISEIREIKFPIFARGLMPKPGRKEIIKELNQPAHCGGVKVFPGDMVVADEEGIVVIPKNQINQILESAQKRAAKEANQSLQEWEAAHHARIEEILKAKGFQY